MTDEITEELLSKMTIQKVHSCSLSYSQTGAGGKRVQRPRWAIVLKYEGETLYTAEKNRVFSNRHRMALLPKGCSYTWHCIRCGHFAIIEFDSPLTADAPIPLSIRDEEKVLKMFRELEYKRTCRKPFFETESIRDTYTILLTLAQESQRPYLPAEKQEKIDRALTYISLHYRDKITNDMLSQRAGISTVYFRKLFREQVGMSPIVYARQLRMQKAKEMLCSDYSTLTDIAKLLGYASIYDFSRDFKKHTGVSPSRYIQEGF